MAISLFLKDKIEASFPKGARIKVAVRKKFHLFKLKLFIWLIPLK
jgi:hypothetical protein